MPELNDWDDFYAWVKTRSNGDGSVVGLRVAERMIPKWLTVGERWTNGDKWLAVQAMRQVLTAALYHLYRDEPARAALQLAIQSQHSPIEECIQGGIACDAAIFTAEAILADPEAPILEFIHGDDVSGTGRSIWPEILRDVADFEAMRSPWEAPLWRAEGDGHPYWDEARAILAQSPAGPFWIDWYQRLLDGRPQDWDLLRKVTLIDHETWHQGRDDLATAIGTIHQDHALNATRNGEEVRLNPETGRLRLVPASDLPEDRADYVRRKIIKAANIFDEQGGQAYGALAADLNMLRRTVADAGNLPVELYDACSSALRRLDVRIAGGECPSTGQDALIGDYRDRLRDAAMDILGSDPEAQEVLKRRAAISDNPALIEARDSVLTFADRAAPLLEGHLAEALPADAALATDPGAEPQERAAASYRLSGRILRVVREIRSGFTGTNGVILGSVAYIQAMEFLANNPLIQAIFRYLGL